MKSPHVIQLSRLTSPKIRRGRPYSVDYGIAKPLHKQLLSKLSGSAHPYWRLITSHKVRLIPGLIAFYMAVFIPFTTPSRIVYAEPKAPYTKVQPIAQLTMPVLAPVEALQPILPPPPPVVTPSAPNTFYNAYTPGQCTAGIAGRIHVPDNLGNAGDWAANAIADGYSVGYVPVVGTVAQTNGDSYLGHVALVEAVNPDGSFLIWEMNGLYGPFTTDERVTTTAEFPNFIHF